jgi:hypothetical protein
VAEDFARAFAFGDEVGREDIAIRQVVQNFPSRPCDRRRRRALRENGVHRFQGPLAKATA